MLVTNNDESQTTNLKLSGRAVFPGVTFSEHELYFANTPSGQTRELSLVIKNHHDELPVTFRSTKVAHFRCRPATGRLLPLQSTQIIVSFCPNQLGRHKGNFVFEIQGSTGQAVGRANVLGSGLCDAEGPKRKLLGGTQATDETFKPNFNFQSPDALANQVKEKERKRERRGSCFFVCCFGHFSLKQCEHEPPFFLTHHPPPSETRRPRAILCG